MTIKEYETIHFQIKNGLEPESTSAFRWELLKAIWRLTDVIKGGLDE